MITEDKIIFNEYNKKMLVNNENGWLDITINAVYERLDFTLDPRDVINLRDWLNNVIDKYHKESV